MRGKARNPLALHLTNDLIMGGNSGVGCPELRLGRRGTWLSTSCCKPPVAPWQSTLSRDGLDRRQSPGMPQRRREGRLLTYDMVRVLPRRRGWSDMCMSASQ